MAIVNGKSGTFNISTKNSAINGYVKWQETYDDATYTSTNKSTVTLTAYLHRTNIYSGETYLLNYPAKRIAYFDSANVTSTSNVSFTIPGNTSANGGAYIEIYRASKEVDHNSDGKKSLSVGFYMTVYDEHNAFEVAKTTSTATLTTIPRATTPTLSATSLTANGSNSVTINIAPASTSFKHKVRYDFGGLTGQSSGVSVGSNFTAQGNTSVTFTPPTSLLSKIPSANSGVCTVYLYTYTSSGTHIGTKSVTLTLNVPSYTPTISNVALTGSNLLSSEYVQGKSTVTVTTTATSSYGATIKSVSVAVDGKTYSGSKITTSVLSSGSKTASVTVTDTRGKTATSTSSAIAVRTYSKPSITSFTVARQSDGTTVVATVKGSVSDVNSKNAKTVTVTLNGKTQTITSSSYTINGSTTFTGISTDSTFNATAKITDSYTSDTKTVVLPTEAVTMDFHHSGMGIAMGKVAEYADLLDVNWVIRLRKTFTLDGLATFKNHLNLSGHIYMGGNKTATGENHVKFNNPDDSAYPHNVYIYGSNPSSDVALGVYDAGKSRNVMNYKDTNNTISFGNGSATINFNGNKMADFVVEQGTSGVWSYRKWNNGRMEVYGTASQTPTALSNGINSITVTLPVSFVDTSFTVNITPAKCGLLVSGFGDCNSSNDIKHTVNSFVLSYKYNHGTAYTTNFNIIASGKWK
jgi:hypothetical protein